MLCQGQASNMALQRTRGLGAVRPVQAAWSGSAAQLRSVGRSLLNAVGIVS